MIDSLVLAAMIAMGAVATGSAADSPSPLIEERFSSVVSKAAEDHRDPNLRAYWPATESKLDEAVRKARSRCTDSEVQQLGEFVVEIGEEGKVTAVFLRNDVAVPACFRNGMVGAQLITPPRAPVFLRVFWNNLLANPGVKGEQ